MINPLLAAGTEGSDVLIRGLRASPSGDLVGVPLALRNGKGVT